MSKLIATEPIRTPASYATAFAAGYLDRFKTDRTLRLRLHVSADELGFPGAANLERDVVARIDWVKPGHLDHGLHITWEPESGGPYPTFSGVLCATPESNDQSILTLSGEYVPPGGFVGALFDGAIGTRIAQATAHDLLRRLRSAAEADYAHRQSP
ncbi:MAG TPA: hypothetical protein VME66_08420 [Candidatus Acidoferrales bacterium]|nr:hypothetical protein [Candidatus Acidoferrales bacterium]